MIHGTGHSYKEYKVLGEFANKYFTSHPTKNRGSNLVPRRKNQISQENYTIINNVLDEILMNEPKK